MIMMYVWHFVANIVFLGQLQGLDLENQICIFAENGVRQLREEGVIIGIALAPYTNNALQ